MISSLAFEGYYGTIGFIIIEVSFAFKSNDKARHSIYLNSNSVEEYQIDKQPMSLRAIRNF